jgi:Gas vesicle synthesis protein GvpL/GvpF
MRGRRKEGSSEAVAASGPDEEGGRRALYLFALLDGEAALPPGESDPFPPPAMARCGAVAALFSMVPLSEYRGSQAVRRLGDRDWLLRRTLAHGALLRAAMRSSPIYPVPFGTLFTSLESLGRFVRAHEERIGGFLRRVAGMEEWELKVEASFSSVAALEALARHIHPEWSGLPAGTAYMLFCRERPALLAAGFEEAERRAAKLVARFSPAALHRLPPPASGGGGGDRYSARFALLMPAAQADALQKKVGRLAQEAAGGGLALALSGPWPPFSFRPDLPAPQDPRASAMATSSSP